DISLRIAADELASAIVAVDGALEYLRAGFYGLLMHDIGVLYGDIDRLAAVFAWRTHHGAERVIRCLAEHDYGRAEGQFGMGDAVSILVAGMNREAQRPDEPVDHGSRVAVAECGRSEEHTSELQSRENLVCRLLLE